MINIFQYLFNKRSEIYDLDFRDALLAQANVRIYRTRTHKTIKMVSLKSLKFIHNLERENALQVLDQRKMVLEQYKDKILSQGKINMDILSHYLPSVSFIKVVEANHFNFFIFEGNGRVAALKEVFGDRDDILVQVEQYHFRNKRGIVRKLNQLRKLNGLL